MHSSNAAVQCATLMKRQHKLLRRKKRDVSLTNNELRQISNANSPASKQPLRKQKGNERTSRLSLQRCRRRKPTRLRVKQKPPAVWPTWNASGLINKQPSPSHAN